MLLHRMDGRSVLSTIAAAACVGLVVISFFFLMTAMTSINPRYYIEPEIALQPVYQAVAHGNFRQNASEFKNLKMTFVSIWNEGRGVIGRGVMRTPIYIIPRVPCRILGYSIQSASRDGLSIHPNIVHDITRKFVGNGEISATNSYLTIQLPEHSDLGNKEGFKIGVIYSMEAKNDFYVTGGLKGTAGFTGIHGNGNRNMKLNAFILLLPNMALFILCILALAVFSAGPEKIKLSKIFSKDLNRKAGMVFSSLLMVYTIAVFLLLFYHIAILPGWI